MIHHIIDLEHVHAMLRHVVSSLAHRAVEGFSAPRKIAQHSALEVKRDVLTAVWPGHTFYAVDNHVLAGVSQKQEL